MFEAHLGPQLMHYVAAALLATTGVLYRIANRSGRVEKDAAVAEKPMGGKSGFSLVLSSKYILLIAGLLVLLNIVNTVGEYILSHLVVAHAAEAFKADPAFDKNAYIGAFYGNCFFLVNMSAVALVLVRENRLLSAPKA